ncbi:MAG: alpha/beta hydrolase [Lachnospiraceae bacterium]|nr:alpha/beta hydrolase [Lachnospiraceae bacterium]
MIPDFSIIFNMFDKDSDKKHKKRIEEMEAQYRNPEGIETIYDITMTEKRKFLKVDIYRPADSDNKLSPVAILVHGGGLMVGDRRMVRITAKRLAGLGYLVFVPSYRLMKEATGPEEICDILQAFAFINHELENYGGDRNRVNVIAESAGVFLSEYAIASMKSAKLRKTIGLPKVNLPINAFVCISGMFYTTKKDMLGAFYPVQIYKNRMFDSEFMKCMNPENPEVLENLPPVLLESSEHDFLKSYTKNYANALKRAGHLYKGIYYKGNEQLTHAFPCIQPLLPESVHFFKKMDEWLKTFE